MEYGDVNALITSTGIMIEKYVIQYLHVAHMLILPTLMEYGNVYVIKIVTDVMVEIASLIQSAHPVLSSISPHKLANAQLDNNYIMEYVEFLYHQLSHLPPLTALLDQSGTKLNLDANVQLRMST